MSSVRTQKVIKLVTHGEIISLNDLKEFIQAVEDYKKEHDIKPDIYTWADFSQELRECSSTDCESVYKTFDGTLSWTAPESVKQLPEQAYTDGGSSVNENLPRKTAPSCGIQM